MSVLLDSAIALLACALFLGIPGWAMGRLLELRMAIPATLMPPAWFVLGLALWTIVLLPSLTFGWSWRIMVALYAGIGAVLIAWAFTRARRRSVIKPGGGMVSPWTVVGITMCFLLAAALRTRMAFDTLFHVGMVRRLLELPHPTFDTLDRILDAGVNPSYVVPAWQSTLAAVAGLTHLDPATVVESMAALVVVVAACSAAGLGRVVTGTAAGEVAGVAAYAWMRVYFPRRELEGDGIAYAFAPGNVVLDVMLPLALAVALMLVRRRGSVSRTGAAVVLGAVTSSLIVVMHANYAVYVAILGVGMVAWLTIFGPWSRAIARRTVTSILAVGVPGIVALVAMLPVLSQLDHFGDPFDARIDYHLWGSGAWEIIRPGHLYDWYGVAGLIATLLVPYAVWRAPRMSRALIGGGVLALCAVAFVPPLLTLLGETGSLTLGLRLSRPFGVLLIAATAVAVPALVTDIRRLADRARVESGRRVARNWIMAPFAATFVLAFAYGYPLARRVPPQYGWDWPTLACVAGVLAVGARLLASRSDPEPGPSEMPGAWVHETRDVQRTLRPKRRTDAAVVGLAVIVAAVCMLPSGVTSLRRGGWQARELVPAVRADDLGCFAGVERELREIEPGSVLLADPITGYGAQALAPAYTLADFKTWNGRTNAGEIDERIALLRRAFDRSTVHESVDGLREVRDRFGARYLLVARHAVQPPLDSGIGAWDARGLRDALEQGHLRARKLAAGSGRMPSNATDSDIGACDLELWELT